MSEVDAPVQESFSDADHYVEVRTYNSTMTGEFCGSTKTQHSLLLKTADHLSRAVIGCQEQHDIQPTVDVTDDLTLINNDVRNINLNLVNDMSLTLVNCVMQNTTITYKSVNGTVALQFVNTTFRGHVNESCLEELNCNTSSVITSESLNITLWYLSSTFLQTRQNIQGTFIKKVIFIFSLKLVWK